MKRALQRLMQCGPKSSVSAFTMTTLCTRLKEHVNGQIMKHKYFAEAHILLVIRFMADLLRKYRGSVVIMVGRGGAEPHYVHN